LGIHEATCVQDAEHFALAIGRARHQQSATGLGIAQDILLPKLDVACKLDLLPITLPVAG
jgi:hypothetical protein